MNCAVQLVPGNLEYAGSFDNYFIGNTPISEAVDEPPGYLPAIAERFSRYRDNGHLRP
jgi:hypothetical protein